MRPSAIQTYENFLKMFQIFYLADYIQKCQLFFETLGSLALATQARDKKNYNQTFSINNFRNWELIWICFREIKL